MLRRVLDRESVVKSNLVRRLADCVKELQFKHAAEKGAELVNDEATNLLCWILEAVFIHGLKNPFLKSMTSVFHARENMIPEPSFWEFVLIFCHQEVIVQINQFSYISSDVGRCRAWLRLALNDGLFISYLQMMLKDKSTLKDYYKPGAFLRDADSCDILKSYLYGIESYDFQLACNSSLLNAWNSGPLSLVGLWTMSNPNESIAQGIDVAENMNSRDLQVLPQLQSDRLNSHQRPSFATPIRPPLLEEDEALRVILASKPSGSRHSSRRSSVSTPPKDSYLSTPFHAIQETTVTDSPDFNSNHRVETNCDSVRLSNLPVGSNKALESKTVDQATELNASFDPSSSLFESPEIRDISKNITPDKAGNDAEYLIPESEQETGSKIKLPASEKFVSTDVEEDSYIDLLNTYNQNHQMGTPIADNFLDSVFPTRCSDNLSGEENRKESVPVSPVERLGFEILSALASNENFSEMQPQVHSYLQRIPVEVGLDSQNYRCKFCDKPIGMIYGPAKLCALTGNYFCQNCHINEESVIPSRILLNWDFGRYNVSRYGKSFLHDIQEKPMFDFSKINNKIYDEVEECEEVRILRAKLQSISLYLRTCKEPVMEEAMKDIWPKDHLYEEVHLYSLADLLNIPNRSLAGSLTKLVNYGKSHILRCDVCKQKGFICEICKDTKVIFPFEFESNYKCLSCGAVYHSTCMNSKQPCPRCERWKASDSSA